MQNASADIVCGGVFVLLVVDDLESYHHATAK